MKNVFKHIFEIQYDVKTLICRAEAYRDGAERGLYVNTPEDDETLSKTQQVESLMSYLIDSKHDIDRLRDDMKAVHQELVDLVDTVEYEAVAEKIR